MLYCHAFRCKRHHRLVLITASAGSSNLPRGLLIFAHFRRSRLNMYRRYDYCMFAPECILSFWTWTSAEPAPIQIDQMQVLESLGLQLQLFQNCLFELKHVLAQDWFQWYLHQGLTDRPYERRGSIFCRPDGSVFLALQTTTAKRGGILIRSSTLPPRAEEALALIGFGLGRRFVSPNYVSQTNFKAGGSIEPIECGSNLPSIYPDWQEFDPSATAARHDIGNENKARWIDPSAS